MIAPSHRARAAVALVAGVLASTCTFPRPARADLWGGDLPLLAGILAEAIAEVSNLSSMLTQILEEAQLMKTMLSGLDPTSFSSLTAFLRTAEATAAGLTVGVRSMSYSLGRVDTEFQQIFPADPSGETASQRARVMAGWSREILAASQIASRQQAAIGTLGDSAAKVQDLALQSQTAPGERAQLQLIVQTLAILHTQLSTIHQTLATTGRVLTDMGAASASERQLSQAKKQNSLSNYTWKGDSVRVPTEMP